MHYYNQFPFLSVIKVKYNAQHYLNTSSCTSLLFRIWRLATAIDFSPRKMFHLPLQYPHQWYLNNTLYQSDHIHIRPDV